MRLLAVAAYDSQIKVASYISHEFSRCGWEVEFRIPVKEWSQVSESQLKDFSKFSTVNYCENSISAILKNAESFSAVLVLLEGNLTQRISIKFSEIFKNRKRRPILVSGFVGVNLFDTCNGYQRRLNSDVLFVNSENDFVDCCRIANEYGLSGKNILLSGLPILRGAQRVASTTKSVSRILFAGQPDVPKRIIERIYILEKLMEYATKFPDRKVAIKPRSRPYEKSIHKTQHHYELLLNTYLKERKVPPNFSIIYDPIDKLLDDTDLFITVTSTAALEALEKGCRVSLIMDFGLSEMNGSQKFVGSGMLATFDELLFDNLPAVNVDWMEKNLNTTGNPCALIFQRVNEISQSGNIPELPIFESKKYKNVLSSINYINENNKTLVWSVRQTSRYLLCLALLRVKSAAYAVKNYYGGRNEEI